MISITVRRQLHHADKFMFFLMIRAIVFHFPADRCLKGHDRRLPSLTAEEKKVQTPVPQNLHSVPIRHHRNVRGKTAPAECTALLHTDDCLPCYRLPMDGYLRACRHCASLVCYRKWMYPPAALLRASLRREESTEQLCSVFPYRTRIVWQKEVPPIPHGSLPPGSALNRRYVLLHMVHQV
jgi:hypothetical protein